MTTSDRLTRVYTGRATYLPDYPSGPDRLLVVVPCLLAGEAPARYALLDTASTWSIVPAEVAQDLGLDLSPEPSVAPLRTARFGRVHGRLEPVWVRFPVEDGDPFDLTVTFFVSADWLGPMVIGWKGCLEAMGAHAKRVRPRSARRLLLLRRAVVAFSALAAHRLLLRLRCVRDRLHSHGRSVSDFTPRLWNRQVIVVWR